MIPLFKTFYFWFSEPKTVVGSQFVNKRYNDRPFPSLPPLFHSLNPDCKNGRIKLIRKLFNRMKQCAMPLSLTAKTDILYSDHPVNHDQCGGHNADHIYGNG